MNWQTPYGEPLLPALLSATIRTLMHCTVALTVSGSLGILMAIVWYGARGLVAAVLKTFVGLMDAMGPILPPLAVLSALQVKSEWAVAFILGALTWNPITAFLKGESDAISKSMFVQAAVSLGASSGHVLLRHILPHIVSRLVPLILGMFASYVGLLGALGFLGVAGGANSSLGFMLYDAKSFFRQNPAYFVGCLSSFTVLILVPNLVCRFAAVRGKEFWHWSRGNNQIQKNDA
jgi:peptide/nickel transport system permease protein